MVSGAAAGADRGRCSDGEIELLKTLAQLLAALRCMVKKPGQRASLPVCRLAAPPRSDVAFAIEVFAQDALYRLRAGAASRAGRCRIAERMRPWRAGAACVPARTKNPILQLTDVKWGRVPGLSAGLWRVARGCIWGGTTTVRERHWPKVRRSRPRLGPGFLNSFS